MSIYQPNLRSVVYVRRSPSLFFNRPATTEIYTLSLHDALPIFDRGDDEWFIAVGHDGFGAVDQQAGLDMAGYVTIVRSEEHTSELQSHSDLVCRLLLEKKKEREGMLCADSHPRRRARLGKA